MDQAELPPEQIDHALKGLARLNYFSRSADILWPRIFSLAQQQGKETLRILDIACGAGDVPLALCRKVESANLQVVIDGCDCNEHMVQFARNRALASKKTCSFFQLDLLSQPLPSDYDVYTCSLFLHHLSDSNAKLLFEKLSHSTKQLLLVNDLSRSYSGYLLAWLATRLLTRSPVVHVDGPRSVRNAFTASEALKLAQQAGLRSATVEKKWPCRFLLSWERSLDDS